MFDVGFSVVEFPDDTTTVAGPSMDWSTWGEWRRLFGRIGAGGVGTVGAATGSASMTGGARAPFARSWLLEGSGELYGVAGSTSGSAGTALGSARLFRVVGHGGAWGRASTSVSRRETGALTGRGGEVGAWWSWPRARLSASLLEQHAEGQLFSGSMRDRVVGTIPVRYAEGTLGLRLEGNESSLDVSAGVRNDPDAAQRYEPTFSVTAAFWRSATRAWTIAISRQPPDWVRGADAARWIAIGMRFNESSPREARSVRTPAIVQLSGEGEERIVRVLAPGARSVELMSDFTGWSPVSLTEAGSVFETRMAVSPGAHRVSIRIDGGRWRPATNTPAVDDDLGGRVGLLLVQ